jgi:hypothetical protein
MSSPLSAEELERCSGLVADGGLCFLGVNYLLCLLE